MFYISARGSSASTWLNRVLSKHKKIVCFQSSRSFPPVWPGKTFPYENTWVKEIEPAKYIESLILCENSTHKEKIFGSTHGYHGIDAKIHCEKFGGIFSYIARNPISRIHSHYIHSLEGAYYKKFNILKNEEIHRRTCEVLNNLNLFSLAKEKEKKEAQNNLIKKKIINLGKLLLTEKVKNKIKEYLHIAQIKKARKNIKPNEKELLINSAILSVRDYLKHDQILFGSCEKNAGLKMEEFVKSKIYFNNVLKKRIDNNIDFSESYLDDVFKDGRFWVHRKKALSPEEIWNSWPASMKDLFIFYFNKFNLKNYMSHFDYDHRYLI